MEFLISLLSRQFKIVQLIGIPILIAKLISILATVFVFVAIYNHRISERLERAWSNKYRGVFYTIATLFALYHLTNFKFSLSLLFFAPIVVLPQFSVGLFMGFLRVKQGLYLQDYHETATCQKPSIAGNLLIIKLSVLKLHTNKHIPQILVPAGNSLYWMGY